MASLPLRPKKKPRPSRVWGLGIIVGDRQKTVVRASDYERIREGLERAARYSQEHAHR